METTQEQTRYHIDFAWFEKNHLSFPYLAARCLCASCQKQLPPEARDNPEKLIKTISTCCSKEKDFIHSRQPIMESLFRLFLSNNNEPLTAKGIIESLNQRRAENPVSMSEVTLHKLLSKTGITGIAAQESPPQEEQEQG
jgi:hypothetical protein